MGLLCLGLPSLLIVLTVHVKENPPVAASESDALERKWATQTSKVAQAASSAPQTTRTDTDGADADLAASFSNEYTASLPRHDLMHLPTSALVKTLTMYL